MRKAKEWFTENADKHSKHHIGRLLLEVEGDA
jgi:hypothetical protein